MHHDDDDFCATIMETMTAHFGDAIIGYWFYEGEFCPCCMTQPISEMEAEGKRALSINGFMYREKGILISYFLCGSCAKEIHEHSKFGTSSMHQIIEMNLVSAYHRYLNSLDA